MEVAPMSMNSSQEPESIIIGQDEKYNINLTKGEDYIIFNILEKDIFPNVNYTKKLTFQEIKDLHKMFYMISSCNEFSEYIKSAFENKKISIKKENQTLILNISVEYLFKNQNIEIPLLEQNINLQNFSKEICQEISLIKEKYEKQNQEIKNLKEENKNLKNEMLN